MVSNMSDYAIFLDEAPNMEEEVDLSNRSTFLPFLKKSYAFWNQKLFGGKLPKDGQGVSIEVTTREGVGGYVSHPLRKDIPNEELRRADMNHELYKCADNTLCVKMDLYGTKSEFFHQTLLHEMCHLAVWTIDNIFEVGNSSKDGYEGWEAWFLGQGLFNVRAVPGHSGPWQKWMKHCGLDPVAGLLQHKFQTDQAVDFTREKQKRQGKIKAFVPTIKELAASNDVSVVPVRFFLDPRAGLDKIGVDSRKVECLGLLSIFQFWNPMGKYFPLTDRRHTMMFLAFVVADGKEGDSVQSSMIDLESVRSLDMCEEWGNANEQNKLLTQRSQEWVPKLQRFLGNKLNPKERLTTAELKDLLLVNIVE